jgi:hypothetical protein
MLDERGSKKVYKKKSFVMFSKGTSRRATGGLTF